MREIEVKVKADNLKEVEKKLAERGCKLSAPIFQHDTIYSYGDSTEEWEESKEGQIVMRLRRENGDAVLNLKQQRSNESDNLEHETKVENADAIHNILGILGYRPQIEVKKKRRKGKLNGHEICLDEVEKLGAFVEIEKLTSDDADPGAVQEELLQKLESLGLSRNNQELRGYDTQMFHFLKTTNL